MESKETLLADALKREAQTMGRAVTRVVDSKLTRVKVPGEEASHVLYVVYELEPLDTSYAGKGAMHETRFAIYVDGQPNTSGIVHTVWEEGQ
jgi:hypothetical protein